MKGTATRFNEKGSLVVGMGEKKQTVKPSEIMYLAGDSNYSRMIRSQKSTIIVSITISKYEMILPDFIRIHKQYIVNPAFIRKLMQDEEDRDSVKLILKNGKRLPVARRRAKPTIDRLIHLIKQSDT